MKQIFCAAFRLASSGLAPALAQTASRPDSAGIAAVVNGEVITTAGCRRPSRLLAISTGMPPTLTNLPGWSRRSPRS